MKHVSYLDEFDSYLKYEKQVSENTRQSYLRDLRHYVSFCGESSLDACVNSYIMKLKSDGRSASTVSRNIASLKLYFNFCCLRGYLKENPTTQLTAEKIERKLPEILDHKEVELLLEQPQCTDLKGYRDKAMLEVLSSTGMRVSELLMLKLSDIDLMHGTVTCGDGKKRTMSLHPSAVKALSEYVSFIRKQMIRNLNEDVLFVNVNGDPMTRQGFWKLLKTYQKKAGITKNITPHTLRHSFAAHSLQSGAGMKSLQKMMGYSDVSVAGIYADFIKESLHK